MSQDVTFPTDIAIPEGEHCSLAVLKTKQAAVAKAITQTEAVIRQLQDNLQKANTHLAAVNAQKVLVDAILKEIQEIEQANNGHSNSVTPVVSLDQSAFVRANQNNSSG